MAASCGGSSRAAPADATAVTPHDESINACDYYVASGASMVCERFQYQHGDCLLHRFACIIRQLTSDK
jgi:hypothetical protein